MDGQNLAVLEKKKKIDNGKEIQTTHQGFLERKKPCPLFWGILGPWGLCDRYLKLCYSYCSAPLLGIKDCQLLVHMGKTEMQPVILKGAWLSVHQGEGNVGLTTPHSLFFNLYLFSLPRFLLYSFSQSLSIEAVFTYGLVSHFSLLCALYFLPACIQLLINTCINESYFLANNLMKISYAFFERNCVDLLL